MSPDGNYWWDGSQWVPVADRTIRPALASNLKAALIGAIVGAGLSFLGLLLPFATLSDPLLGATNDVSYITGDGVFVALMLAASIGLIVLLLTGRWPARAAWASAAIALPIIVLTWHDAADSAAVGDPTSDISVQLGAGPYVIVIGALVMLVAAAIAAIQHRPKAATE